VGRNKNTFAFHAISSCHDSESSPLFARHLKLQQQYGISLYWEVWLYYKYSTETRHQLVQTCIRMGHSTLVMRIKEPSPGSMFRMFQVAHWIWEFWDVNCNVE